MIFKKSAGKVLGDAINVEIKDKTSKKLLPLFNQGHVVITSGISKSQKPIKIIM